MAIGDAVNPPRTALLATTPATVQYQSTSVNFNGYVWLGLTVPSATGSYSYKPQLFNSIRRQQLPRFIKVPVLNGVIDTTTQIHWNVDIDPPGTSYVAYWFDDNDVLIAPASGTAVAFSVGSATYQFTAPTLPVPSYTGATPPVPEP